MAVNARTHLNWPPFMSTVSSRAADRTRTRWGIVLAAGEDTQMHAQTSDCPGGERPKQYGAVSGSRPMLQHTVDRARSVVPKEQVVTVIGNGRREYLAESANGNFPGPVLEEPGDLGTAPGVFLPISYVLAKNPEAVVILLPSDHFVHPEDRFCDSILQAFELLEKNRDHIILAGAIPDRAETGYGWIVPEKRRTNGRSHVSHGPAKVMHFRENPGEAEADELFRQGCLWNTMVIAARAKTLWLAGRQCLPEMMSEFDAYRMVLRAIYEGRLDARFEAIALVNIYKNMAPADFSEDVLLHFSRHCIVLPLDGVDWCDWGRPQRVTETLARLGRRPSFQEEDLETPPGQAIAGEARSI